jgi:hypothetical protein
MAFDLFVPLFVTPFVQGRAKNRAAPLLFDDLASHCEAIIVKRLIRVIDKKDHYPRLGKRMGKECSEYHFSTDASR